jgi:hypothetical protein
VDNENVTIWDEILTTTRHTLRKIVRDVLAVQIWDGATTIVNGEDAAPTEVPRGADQKPRRRMPSVYYLPAGTGPYSQAAVDPYRLSSRARKREIAKHGVTTQLASNRPDKVGVDFVATSTGLFRS